VADIVAVFYSDTFGMTSTRYWKKQLNKLDNGKFEVEVYDIPFISCESKNHNPVKEFDTEEEAYIFYKKITSIYKCKKLFTS
jgi:hypothetical protein